MSALPYYVITLTHPDWEEALACAKRLGSDTLPELRLDLFPDQDPEAMVDALHRHCLVSCRRRSEGGQWPDEEEAPRLERLQQAVQARPEWVDLEWDLPLPTWMIEHRTHTRMLRSVHVAPGVFDLEARLQALPDGDAFKWVGHAGHLSDNARLSGPLAWARDHQIPLSAFLMGPKGMVSRVFQAAWGGSFTYACPNDAPPAAPGQLTISQLREMRSAKLPAHTGLCGVLGFPVLHSRGPAFHNERFQRSWKDLVYLPLEAEDATQAVEAMAALQLLGVSITAPLKESLPAALALKGPLNTLWRRDTASPWEGANTDAEALRQELSQRNRGPVLVLGSGGVAHTCLAVLRDLGCPTIQASRRAPLSVAQVQAFGPMGVIQATSLGMSPEDPLPFPELLEAASPTLRWAVEWIYKADTAFAAWAQQQNLDLVEGHRLFELQAEAQSHRFIQGCG